jgi:Multiubiquitin
MVNASAVADAPKERRVKQMKTVTIVIDGTPHEVAKDTMTYAEIVTLAYPDYPSNPQITYSVTYKRGHGNKPEGTLSLGGSVNVKDGMIFNVSRTGQS